MQPIVESEICSVVGIIECAPRIKLNRQLVNVLLAFVRSLCGKTLYGYAKKRNIPYFYMKYSDDTLSKWVGALHPDLIVVFSMSQLLKESIFSIPKYGTINLHPALLPKYRGPNPDFWQYYNTDLTRGVTVHYIDKGEDTGDILLQKSFVSPLGMTSVEVRDKLISKIGVNLLLSAIQNIETLPRIKQPSSSPTPRARNIKSEEHSMIIDWNAWNVERVWHFLRGTQDWLNAISPPKKKGGGVLFRNTMENRFV